MRAPEGLISTVSLHVVVHIAIQRANSSKFVGGLVSAEVTVEGFEIYARMRLGVSRIAHQH